MPARGRAEETGRQPRPPLPPPPPPLPYLGTTQRGRWTRAHPPRGVRHRRRTAAQRCPPIPESLSLVPPTAPQRRSRSRTPRPPRSIQALGLRCSRHRLYSPAFTPWLPRIPWPGTLPAVRVPPQFISSQPRGCSQCFAPSPCRIPSPNSAVAFAPAPWETCGLSQSLRSARAHFRFRPPLDGRAPRCALAPAPALCRTCLPSWRLPPLPGLGGRGWWAGARWGPFPTDAAWGATRGIFENLTVGVGGLDLPAAVPPGHYTWHPLRPPRPRSAQRWRVEAWSGKAVTNRLRGARRAVKLEHWHVALCQSEPEARWRATACTSASDFRPRRGARPSVKPFPTPLSASPRALRQMAFSFY